MMGEDGWCLDWPPLPTHNIFKRLKTCQSLELVVGGKELCSKVCSACKTDVDTWHVVVLASRGIAVYTVPT